MTEDLKIYQKWLDASVYIHNMLKHFPSEEKFLLSSDIRRSVTEIGVCIDLANNAKSAAEKHRMADELERSISKVKRHLDEAWAYGYFGKVNEHGSADKHGLACDHLKELGRMVGGWRKTFRDKPLN